MPTQPSKQLETFSNPCPDRDYTIEMRIPEFTCLCPKTGQPDFATLHLDYVPDRKCIELKSLKLYIWSYRNEGAFHEAVTNTILADLVAATAPRYMRLRAEFYVRGGIYTTVVVEHRKPDWKPAPPLPALPIDPEQAPLTSPATPAADSAVVRPSPAPAAKNSSADNTGSGARGGRFRMLPRERRPATETPPDPEESEPEPAPVAASGVGRARATMRTNHAVPVKPPAPIPDDGIYIGVDLGTAGCRALAVSAQGELLAEADAPIPMPIRNENQVTQDSGLWWKAASATLQDLASRIAPERVRAIAVDGTSGTLLLCDSKGAPITPAMMYNDSRALAQSERIRKLADRNSGAQGATSSLAKLLWLHEKGIDKKAAHAMHQADWIAGKLTGRWGHSDYNNCLKLGYNAEHNTWPDWIRRLGFNPRLLPEVHSPGEVIAPISGETAKTFGFPADTVVVAGTTDGVAAFLAAGGTAIGDAVTSLGSTLVLKMLSEEPVFSVEHGVYSHRLDDHWLVGGASNSGGATLLQYFKIEQMREMTNLLDPENLTGLEYYPLPDVGERFPVNDPNMVAKLEPLPGNSVTFFQAMLEGIARIEAQGYTLLHTLGGPKLHEIRTTGGGSRNAAWQRIRERILGVPLAKPRSERAAFGTALLGAKFVHKSL
ncbi:MAG: preQ(1) synthase [Acidiferrobacterales bacterium]